MSVRAQYRKRLVKDDVLIREGEHGTELYVLEKGVLEVFILGRKVGTIDASHTQEFVGEVAALLGQPRTATVIAATDCLVLAIPKLELESVLNKAPSISAKLARSLCRKLLNSAQAHVAFHDNEKLIVKSGSTDVSLRNYMRGVLHLIDTAADDATLEQAQRLREYFRATNPWGLQYGDASMLMQPEEQKTGTPALSPEPDNK
ncbi:MAG: cyclic nucleotide-binding domain-containing protein [Lentisphaerae bacterium]|nr:cyclic nucleotide-binding domain-containing protein [Lentisphaerota bacterium]